MKPSFPERYCFGCIDFCEAIEKLVSKWLSKLATSGFAFLFLIPTLILMLLPISPWILAAWIKRRKQDIADSRLDALGVPKNDPEEDDPK